MPARTCTLIHMNRTTDTPTFPLDQNPPAERTPRAAPHTLTVTGGNMNKKRDDNGREVLHRQIVEGLLFKLLADHFQLELDELTKDQLRLLWFELVAPTATHWGTIVLRRLIQRNRAQ